MALIDVRNVKKIYKPGDVEIPALKGISFTIETGEFVAIMGQSGSGKSTLLHILGLLDRPTIGEYLFKGKNINEYSDDELAYLRNEELGFIFQKFNLLKRTTVLENIKLPLYYSRIPESKWDALAKKAIEAVGLTHRINNQSSQLSGGEQQRVAIARAIVNEPSVIFADEPTGNLDSESGGQVMEIIQDLYEEGHTIVLITHEHYTSEYARRIITLTDGLLLKDLIKKKNHRKRKEDFKK